MLSRFYSPHPFSVAYRADDDGHVDIRVSLPAVGYRDVHFRRLRRQATALLNSLEGVGQRTTASDPTPSEGNDSPSQQDAANEQSMPSSGSSTLTPASQNVSFSRLAGMLTEQRRLWRRMQPYLNQWETMLRSEQEAQTPSNSTNAETPSSENRESHAEQPEPMDSTESTSQAEWSQRVSNMDHISIRLYQLDALFCSLWTIRFPEVMNHMMVTAGA